MGSNEYINQCISLSFSIFKSLSTEELDMVNSNLKCNTYRKGEIIYREGSRITGIYCVKKGILKIYKTGIDSKPQIVAFAIKGDITGYRSVLSNEMACTTAEIIEEAEICFIPSNIIFSLIKSNSDFALSLIQLTCRELDQANIFIKDIAQKTVKQRVAEILLMLQNTFKTDAEGFILVNLTREDISSIVGTATESVIRILSDFKSENLISVKGRKIKIIDKKKLTLISDSIY